MRQKKQISIIIPTYNERQNIGKLIHALVKKLSGYDFEIIVVDDHSPDGTAIVVRRWSKKNPAIRLFLNPPPRGLSYSILLGIQKARGKVVVGMDADFNHDPKIIKQLIQPVLDEKYDMVVASRFINSGGMENKVRFYCTLFFNQVLRSFFAFPLTDNASGYYAIKSKYLHRLSLKKIYTGYGEYHLRLVYMAHAMNFKMNEVPVFYPKRMYGESKSRLFDMMVTYLTVAWQLRFHS